MGFGRHSGNGGNIGEGPAFAAIEGFDPRADRPEPRDGPTAGRAEPAADLNVRQEHRGIPKRGKPVGDGPKPGKPVGGDPQPGKPAADVPTQPDFPTQFTGAWGSCSIGLRRIGHAFEFAPQQQDHDVRRLCLPYFQPQIA